MNCRHVAVATTVILASALMTGCQSLDLAQVRSNALSIITVEKASNLSLNNGAKADTVQKKSLNEILNGALAARNVGTDFLTTVSSALERDPVVIAQKNAVEAKLAAIGSSEAKKEYQVSSALYGGIEDITDNTKGLALSLNASRMIFDGGLVDAQIASATFEAEASRLDLKATVDERAYRLGEIWIELEKQESLQALIDSRLDVLDPLISQLEQVAKAGIGDVTKVTAAQRTVSGIRVTQTNISEGLAKARLDFLNAYGPIQDGISYDAIFVENLLPEEVDDLMAQKSPALLAKYASYNAAVAKLQEVSARDDVSIGFEARAMRPFAGSGYDSDESIGLVARKTLYTGGMLEAQISEAEAIAETSLTEIRSVYRRGARIIQSAQQSIESMDNAIRLAKENAKVTSDEIVYLRQQLVIGGSTLDSVLSAEARLYEAESREITFLADKRKSQLIIASTLGLLSSAFDFQ